MKNVQRENNLGDPIVSFQMSSRLSLLPKVKYCTLYLAAHSLISAIDRNPAVRLVRAKAKGWNEQENDHGARAKPSQPPAA